MEQRQSMELEQADLWARFLIMNGCIHHADRIHAINHLKNRGIYVPLLKSCKERNVLGFTK